MNRRTLVTGVMLTMLLVTVAGCGRRGSLEAPNSVESTEPHSPRIGPPTPAPSNVEGDASQVRGIGPAPTVSADGPYGPDWPYKAPVEVLNTPKRKSDKDKPSRPFILDSLVN